MTIGDLAHLGSPRGAQRDPAPQIARGRVVRAPASVTDSMVVALDRYALAFPYEVLSGRWPAGGRLPQSGDVCLVIFDDAGDAWVRGGGWQAVDTPTGAAGGDLGGSYPNPTVQHVLNGQTPVTVAGGAQLKTAVGTATVTWPGATTLSNMATIAHGLGRLPQGYAVFANGTTSGLNLNFHCVGTNKGAGQSVSIDATSLYIRGVSDQGNPNAAETGNVLWTAIG